MAVVPFKYYLHDDYNSFERAEHILKQCDLPQENLEWWVDKIGRPFYEICLVCTLDTESGEVKIVSIG